MDFEIFRMHRASSIAHQIEGFFGDDDLADHHARSEEDKWTDDGTGNIHRE